MKPLMRSCLKCAGLFNMRVANPQCQISLANLSSASNSFLGFLHASHHSPVWGVYTVFIQKFTCIYVFVLLCSV